MTSSFLGKLKALQDHLESDLKDESSVPAFAQFLESQGVNLSDPSEESKIDLELAFRKLLDDICYKNVS